jgi:hypothetical protein
MEIITNNESDKEIKSAKLIKKVIDKYKREIPLLIKKIKIQESNSIKHNIPIISLTTDPLRYKYSNNVFLYLLINENLKYFAANLKSIKKTLLIDKYQEEFTENNRLKKESGNKIKRFVNNIIVIFNEINITHSLIKTKRLNYIYKHFSNNYRSTRQWVLDNFDKLKNDLTELNFVWSI